MLYPAEGSQPLAIVYNFTGDDASDSGNLLEFGGIGRIETDDSAGLILEYGIPLSASISNSYFFSLYTIEPSYTTLPSSVS